MAAMVQLGFTGVGGYLKWYLNTVQSLGELEQDIMTPKDDPVELRG